MTTWPQFVQYFAPVLQALKELGGSGRPAEVRDRIIQNKGVTDAELAVVNKSGQSRFENQVHWARFYLARAGYVDASTRGVWSLTEKAKETPILNQSEALKVFAEIQSQFGNGSTTAPSAQAPVAPSDDTPAPSPASDGDDSNYRAELLDLLQKLPPAGFERLCQRLLREAGFEQVIVTGKSGDGGIDGQGVLQVNPFVSLKVLFQCKRYIGTVGSPQVRDFRGATIGRADKGIIITTGTFSPDAQKEALRDGASPIELVNGDKLLDMFEKLELGLKPRKTFDVDHQFFEPFQK
jgi:restriction system protein